MLYTLPNFFGEAPAVQVSSGKATLKLDAGIVPRIEAALQKAGIKADFVQFDGNSVKARFADTDTADQGQGRDLQGAEPRCGRPELHRRAEPAVALAGLAAPACTRCRCTWAWTCAAACTS